MWWNLRYAAYALQSMWSSRCVAVYVVQPMRYDPCGFIYGVNSSLGDVGGAICVAQCVVRSM
eukprot:7021921-Pyramimonas_sp.AAC.1